MAAEMDPLKSHDIIDNIEEAFREEENILLVLHYDPIVTSDEAVGNLRRWIVENIRRIDPRLTIHDLRIVPGPTHTNVIFDAVIPNELSISDEQARKEIVQAVSKLPGHYNAVVTIDKPYLGEEMP